MTTPDKIESIQKVGEAGGTKSAGFQEDVERVAPNKEHFQNLINSTSPLQKNAFERVIEQNVHETTQITEKNPIFSEQSLSSQKSGSATDQENKRGKQDQEDEIESISRSSKSSSSIEASQVAGELNKLNADIGNISKASNPAEIKSQAQNIVNQMDKIKGKLSQVQDIKPSYQTLLRNRLTHIDDNLKIALSKAGVEHPSTVAKTGPESRVNPVTKFIDAISESQVQLENIYKTIEQKAMSGEPLSPATMLTLQLKMGYIQHQVELFSNLLNKALEGTKTIMNIQV